MASQFAAEYACMVRMREMSRMDSGISPPPPPPLPSSSFLLAAGLTAEHVDGAVDEHVTGAAGHDRLTGVDHRGQEPVAPEGALGRPGRVKAELFRHDVHRGVPEAGDAVDVRRVDAGVGDGLPGRLERQLETGDAGLATDLRNADAGDDRTVGELLRTHAAVPVSGSKSGT